MENPIKEKTETSQRLVKNSIWLFSAEAAAKVLALAIQVLAARYLGDQGFGIFSFAFALTGAFIVFIDIGIGIFLTREVARRPDQANDYLNNVFALKWVLSLLMVLTLAAALSFISLDRDTLRVVWTIGLALMVNGYTDMYLAVFRAHEKMSLVSVLMVLQRVLFLGLGFLSLILGYDVVAFSSTFLTASIVIFVLSRWQMHARFQDMKFQLDRDRLREIFRAVLPICGIILFSYIYFRVDAVMVFFMHGESQTGWYSAAFKLIEALSLLIASIRAALFPILSRSFADRSGYYQRIWKEAVRYLLMIGVPVMAGIILLAPALVGWLFGSTYEPAIRVFQIMALGFPLLCLNDFAAYFLLSRNQTRQVMKVVISGAVFNLILNLIVIPVWGIIGAASIACMTELFVFLFYCRHLKKSGIQLKLGIFAWRPAVAAAGMVWVLWALNTMPVILLLLVGLVAYFIILIFLQTFNEYDFLILRGLLNRDSMPRRSSVPGMPPVSLDLTIITINYKSVDYLKACLQSIIKNVQNIRCEIIVVDNDSRDGSVESIREEFPDVHLIENRDNVGFARANNQGIRMSRGKYVLLLNNDTQVLPGAFQTMIEIMEKSPNTGLLGCRLMDPDHNIQESFGRMANFINEFARKFVLNKLYKLKKVPAVKKFLDWIHSSEKQVDWVCGACMMFRREALIEAGLMDEAFFMYMEDVDMGVCLRRLGWEVAFTPAAAVIHHEGGSSKAFRFRIALEYRKSQLYFYKKHYGRLGLIKLKVYLYLKTMKNIVVTQLDRLMSRKKQEELEESERLNREVFAIIKNYR